MAPRLPIHAPEGKRDIARKTRRDDHAEALERAIGRICRHVAEDIGLSMRSLEEQAAGDKRGDGERLEIVVAVAREHKSEADAIAPVAVLARRLGYDLAPLACAADQPDIVAAAAVAGKELSEALGAALEVARMQAIRQVQRASMDPRGVAVAVREIHEAIAALHALAREIQECVAVHVTVA